MAARRILPAVPRGGRETRTREGRPSPAAFGAAAMAARRALLNQVPVRIRTGIPASGRARLSPGNLAERSMEDSNLRAGHPAYAIAGRCSCRCANAPVTGAAALADRDALRPLPAGALHPGGCADGAPPGSRTRNIRFLKPTSLPDWTSRAREITTARWLSRMCMRFRSGGRASSLMS